MIDIHNNTRITCMLYNVLSLPLYRSPISLGVSNYYFSYCYYSISLAPCNTTMTSITSVTQGHCHGT